MAKFFLVLFSLLLTFSLGVFIFDQVLLNTAQSPRVSTLDPTLEDEKGSETSEKPEAPKTPIQITKKSSDTFDFKKFYQSKIRPLVQKMLSNEEVEVKTNTEMAQPDEVLKQDEELLADDLNEDSSPVSTTETVIETATKPAAETVKTPTNKKTAVSAKASATKKATSKSPSVTKTEAPKVTKTTNTSVHSTPTGWSIQVAAFRSRTDAETVSAELEKGRYPNFIYQTELSGSTWYRVNIGPFESPGAAATYKQSRNIGKKFKGAFVKKL